MKAKITLVLAMLFSLYSFGHVGTVFISGGIKYKITAAATVAVTKNTCVEGEVNIPAEVVYNSTTYSVRGFQDGSFAGCTGLTSVSIPNSVTSIGASAFEECMGLTSITIPNSVTSIGASAFHKCTGLTSITMPSSVTSIGAGAFYECRGLTSINIPNSVTNIGEYAFGECLGLKSIIIPNSVTIIGNNAFFLCTGLTSLTIANSVTTIQDSAFYYCNNLKSVTVNWTTPLEISASVFSGHFGHMYIQNLFYGYSTQLNVPPGKEAAYKAAAVWKDFGTIATLNTIDFATNNTLKFYPNPTTSSITFAEEINTLEVFDIFGKKVKSFNNPSTSFDVSALEKGVYILKGKTAGGTSINEKLIKE